MKKMKRLSARSAAASTSTGGAMPTPKPESITDSNVKTAEVGDADALLQCHLKNVRRLSRMLNDCHRMMDDLLEAHKGTLAFHGETIQAINKYRRGNDA